MRILLSGKLSFLMFVVAIAPTAATAQRKGTEITPSVATGTLNIILANRNGFVIATDSRMSSDVQFLCHGRMEYYCDDSQKLFRTTAHSAAAIAGFAVGRANTALDFSVAAVLRKAFPPNGAAVDDQSESVPGIIESTVMEPLTGVAAIHDPSTSPQNLTLTVTFARLNRNSQPVLSQMQFVESWVPTGPLQVLAPRYTVNRSREVQITGFTPVTVGINFVADAILSGIYKSDDPAIQNFYRQRKAQQLDAMPLNDMRALSAAMLRETTKLTDYVGGDDQIGVFPVQGDPEVRLPRQLASDKQTIPRLMRWEGMLCTSIQSPPCGITPISFSFNSAQPSGEIRFMKFILASEFRNVAVALDDNLFVANRFEGVTLKWNGGYFLSYRNVIQDCILEVRPNAQLDRHPELANCRVIRKADIEFPEDTIGLPFINLMEGTGSFALGKRQMTP